MLIKHEITYDTVMKSTSAPVAFHSKGEGNAPVMILLSGVTGIVLPDRKDIALAKISEIVIVLSESSSADATKRLFGVLRFHAVLSQYGI